MDPRIAVGIALGLVLAVALWPSGPEPVHRGTLRPDTGGDVREFVIQYVPAAAEIVVGAYRDFLSQIPANRTVHVLCPDQAAFDDLVARVGPVSCRLHPVPAGHPMTCWSRDRWVALARPDKTTVLLAPSAEEGRDVWPARAGDGRVAFDLAVALDGVEARRSNLGFDGGDFVADADLVVVTPRVAERNGAATPEEREMLTAALEAEVGRRVILLERAPPYHAGMYLMLTGDRTALVGRPVVGPGRIEIAPDDAPFNAVADRLAAEGYRVVRIPVVPGADGRTWLTGVNVIQDGRTVYIPVYDGAEELNRAVAATWRGLGFEVREVDCTATYPHYGSLRCLVSVLR